MAGSSRSEQRVGLLNGFAAYGMWGLVPLFWPLLKPAGAGEILAHRMVWSLAFVAVALLVVRRWAWAGSCCGSRAGSVWSPWPRRSSPSTGASTSGL